MWKSTKCHTRYWSFSSKVVDSCYLRGFHQTCLSEQHSIRDFLREGTPQTLNYWGKGWIHSKSCNRRSHNLLWQQWSQKRAGLHLLVAEMPFCVRVLQSFENVDSFRLFLSRKLVCLSSKSETVVLSTEEHHTNKKNTTVHTVNKISDKENYK